MKLKYILLFVSLCGSVTIFSQKKISVNKVCVTKPIDVAMPLMLDSVNLRGERFENKNLLETLVTMPDRDSFTEEVRADVTTEYFYFQKPKNEARFLFAYFQITADRYAKATLKVTSTSMFEVYINGKKEISKGSIQDSLIQAKVADKEFTCLPGTNNNIVVKYLSLPTNIAPEGFKASIETAKNDSLTNFKISNTGKRSAQIEDILKGTRISGIRISPDGQFVFINTRSVGNDGKPKNNVELLEIKTNRRTNLGDKHVNWMPRSNRFYYTRQVGDELQLLSVDPQTFSETILANNVPSGNYRFLPNEESFLLSEKESFDERKGDLRLLSSPEDRQPGYLDRYFIFRYDLKTGLKQRLTFGRQSANINDISSDSRYLLFSTTRETISEYPFRQISMFKLDMQDMSVDTLWVDDPFAYSAVFSPDGKKILIAGAPEAFSGIGLNVKEGQIANNYDIQAYIMDLSTKKVEPITKDFDPSVNDAKWSSFDNKIYFMVVDKDCESVYEYDLQKKLYTKLNLSEEVVKDFSMSNTVPFVAYFGQSVSNSTKGYVCDLRSRKSTLVSDPLATTMDELTLSEVKDWDFTASDGTTIIGRYYLPPGFDSSKKYPMIVYYYGGTLPTARTFDYPYPMHVYAAQGYVVYVLQPSGTVGFGQEFSARHVNAWGKRTADDIIEGTKQFVKEHSFVDASKIGCIGASYGGFMTMYLQTQTDLFAAAVSHAGISSLASYWGEGYWGYTYNTVAAAHSYPWNNKDLFVGQSPLFHADKINTPLLLLHGMDDTNVPIGESIQMFTALKILGRPVEFIQVKGENHGILTYKKRIEWSYSINAWFAKWLKNDSAWWDSMYPPLK